MISSDPRRSQRFLANVTYMIGVMMLRTYHTSSTVARSCKYRSASSDTRISLAEQSRVVRLAANASCGVSHHEVCEVVVGNSRSVHLELCIVLLMLVECGNHVS